MTIRILLLLLTVVLTSCESSVKEFQPTSNEKEISNPPKVEIKYTKFDPIQVQGFELDGYNIDATYKINSVLIINTYSDGDIETSATPTNWGDRLVLMKNDSILFQSKGVGDPYEFQPQFYSNSANDKVIIICQLGNEESYGGQAFLLEDEEIEFIGMIEIESELDSEEENCMTDIVRVSEKDNFIYFDFESNSDSLVYLGDDNFDRIRSVGVRYEFKEHTFTLLGL
ncbi:MAG: hypothetical protein HRT57_07315 [Crocinitomicaceae bacterium]|nr:hypothetical protein [Crocinitomicaceae bacterium]